MVVVTTVRNLPEYKANRKKDMQNKREEEKSLKILSRVSRYNDIFKEKDISLLKYAGVEADDIAASYLSKQRRIRYRRYLDDSHQIKTGIYLVDENISDSLQ